MASDKIWVVVDRSGDKVAPVSLELLTKARELGDHRRRRHLGRRRALAAEAGAHGATALHTVGDLGEALPGPGGGRRPGGPDRRRATAPTPSSCRRPTTAATSPAACRSGSTGRC